MHDEGSLRSALAAPYAAYEGTAQFPSVPAKGACLLRGLVKNHALADGNKRLGVVATTVFLLINGWQPRYTPSELYLYALRIASRSGNYPTDWIEGWIRRKCRLAPNGELRAARRQIERFWRETDFTSVRQAIDQGGIRMTTENPEVHPTPRSHIRMILPENGTGTGRANSN